MPFEIILVMPENADEWRGLAPSLELLGAKVTIFADAAAAAQASADLIAVLPEKRGAERFEDIDIDAWLLEFERWANCAFLATQNFATQERSTGKPSIAHIVEREAFFGGDGAAAAIASFASAGLSRVTALDLVTGGHCNCVASGTTDAEIATLAPLLIHLAEGDVTGQVIAVHGSEIHLVAQPRPIRVAQRDGGWTETDLAGALSRWSSAMPPAHETAKDIF